MYDVIVIGSGPAGMMTCIEASKNNKVLLLEKNDISGKKLLLTGGGRCNVTNLKSNRDFLDNINYNKKYLYSIINEFGPQDIYDFFTKHGVKLKEEEDNKIFPVSNRSSEILECLLNQMKKVDIRYHENVNDIKINGDIKEVITNKGTYTSKNIVIAVGGNSYKITGSTGDINRFSSMLNQPFIPFFPVEVSLITNDDFSILTGISIKDVKIKCKKKVFMGDLLFTHRGISGPSVFKVSDYVYLNNIKKLSVDLLCDKTIDELKEEILDSNKDKELVTILNAYFSKKFCIYLLDKLDLNIKVKNLNIKTIDLLVNNIKNFEISIKCTDVIDRAFVTGGGVNMKYINTMTMESLINKGIYFVGEALDIYGPIGGYNITLALSTGYVAGNNINKGDK